MIFGVLKDIKEGENRPWIRPEDILGIADRALDPAPPATTTRSNNFYQK